MRPFFLPGGRCLKLLLPALVFLSLLAIGALGFKEASDCQPLADYTEKLLCYHEAAISRASLAGQVDPVRHVFSDPAALQLQSEALQACQAILGVQPVPTFSVDTRVGQANRCYHDIAIQMQDKTVCGRIQTGRTVFLTGVEKGVTTAACEEKIDNLWKAQQYQCAVLFVPLAAFLLLGAIGLRQHP